MTNTQPIQTTQDDRLLKETLNALTVVESQAIRLALLNELSTALNTVLTEADILGVLAEKVPLLVDSDWAGLALLDENKLSLFTLDDVDGVVPHAGPFPVENSLLGLSVFEKGLVVVTQLQDETIWVDAPILQQYKLQSVVSVPLMVREQLLGTLTVGRCDSDVYDLNDESFMMQLAALIASTLDNRRLVAQTQTHFQTLIHERMQVEADLARRVSELETILQISTAMTSLNTDELLQTVVNLVTTSFGFYHTHIYLLDKAGATLQLTTGFGEVGAKLASQGWEIPIDSPDALVAFTARTGEGVIVDNVNKTDFFLRNPLLPKTKAEMAIPITLNGVVMGVFDVQSEQENYFTNDHLRLLSTIAAQIAVSLQKARHFQDAHERAEQLHWLTMVASSLSQANSEAEILTSLAFSTDLADLNYTALLHYFDVDADNQLVSAYTVAIWQDGLTEMEHPDLNQVYPMETWPLWPLWQQVTREVRFIADIQDNVHLNDTVKLALLPQNIRAVALIPLQISKRWLGGITLAWQEPHIFSENERFYLRYLLESISAIVASRRATLQQQEALNFTETLYYTGKRLNEATTLQEIVAVMAEAIPITVINRAILLRFTYDAASKVDLVTVVANWYSGHGPKPTPIGSAYTQQHLPSIEDMLSEEPIFLPDTEIDPDLLSESKAILLQQKINAAVLFPLWGKGHQWGVLMLKTDQPYHFTEQEIRPYVALSQQMAVAIENIELLTMARAKAQQEQILRQVTSEIRRAADVDTVLRTTTREIGKILNRKVFVELK